MHSVSRPVVRSGGQGYALCHSAVSEQPGARPVCTAVPLEGDQSCHPFSQRIQKEIHEVSFSRQGFHVHDDGIYRRPMRLRHPPATSTSAIWVKMDFVR